MKKQSASMRSLCTPTEVEEALDEVHAPTESGGVELAYSGRIRALAFRLITEGNQQRSQVHLLRSAIQIALKEWHKFTDHLDDSIAVRDILENALADTAPTGPSEGSTGKPGSGSVPKAPLSNFLSAPIPESPWLTGASASPVTALPPVTVYLAAKFVRQAEMRANAAELRSLGYICDPAWLGEAHDLPVDAAPDDPRGRKFAEDDVHDLQQAEMVVCFTEPPGDLKGRGRGGRHVEMGMALALGKRVVVIGWRENVFCWLPQVEFYPSWAAFRDSLDTVD